MKNWLKIISLVLVFALSFSLVGCFNKKPGNENENETQIQSEEKVTEAVPELVEKNNYGETFYLNVLPDVNPFKYYWVEESENDALSESIFARQQKVFQYLGVEVYGTKTGNFQNYVTPFKTAVKNRDGSVDTLITHVCTGVPGFISEGYLSDLADQLHISERHAERLVLQYTGRSFREELVAVRMRIAHQLMQAENASLEQIAKYVGYRSYSGFWKAMKRYESEHAQKQEVTV